VWSAWSSSTRYFQICRRRACSSSGAQTTDPPGSSRTTRLTEHSGRSGLRTVSVRRALVVAVAAGTAFASLTLIGLSTASVASAATTGAPAVAQCNPPDFPITAGFQVTCTVAVVNTTTSMGATNSTVTTSACLAPAGVPFPSCPLNLGPVTSTTSSSQLVTSVNQCNGIVTDGGSNVYCNVTVTNNVPVGTSSPAVTVDQCIGSANGGGSTESCAPSGSTTNATVTQCNGSGTGGGTYGGEPTVGCTVTGGTSALPVTVNQCNGTATGGGSAVTCMTTVTNHFIASVTTTTTTTTSPTAPPGTAGSGTTSASGSSGATPAGGTTPAGAGVTGQSGSAPGAGGSTGSPTIAAALGTVPSGGAQTGFGGASHSRNGDLLVAGILALVGAGLACTVGIRRRRSFSARGANETP
jgi:hypothetical protein